MGYSRRIPSRIVMPFGVTVTIHQVPPTHEYLYCENGYTDGMWDPATKRIAVDKTLPAKRKRAIIYHELLHAVNDIIHELQDEGIIRA